MRSFSLILFLLIAGCPGARAELPADWSTNYDVTLTRAKTNQAPSLVYFTASWCGPCKLMTQITLTDPAVVQEVSNIVHVAVDIDEHPDLAARQGIDAVPTFVLLSSTGDEVDRTTGFQPVGDFLPWLTNGVSEAREAAARQALAKQMLVEVDQLLVATRTNSTHLAALKLFDLCAAHDDAIIHAAVARLKLLATRDPAAVLEGLNDPRLATRIQAANALHDTIGDSFNVDPWSGAASRRKAIEAWREKLSGTSSSAK